MPKESLYKFMNNKSPSQREGIRTVWRMNPFELPPSLKDLPTDRRKAIIACYSDNIFLTMEKFPELLKKGYLWLTSCDPDYPENSTDYANKRSLLSEDVLVGTDLLNWGFDYNKVGVIRKTYYRDEKDRNHDKPLFVVIRNLETEHMPERLEHYKLFRSLVESLY